MTRIVLIIIFVFISIISFSQNDLEKRDSSFNDEKYHLIMSKIDTITSPDRFVNYIWYIWTNRDGAIGIEVSTYIANAIIKYPDLIFKKFANNPKSFNEWIDRLPYDLFTDYSGIRIDELKTLKKDLISKLNHYDTQTIKKDYSKIIKKLLDNISVVQIRKID